MTSAELSSVINSLSNTYKPSIIRKALSIKKSTFYYKASAANLSIRKKQEASLLPLIQEISVSSRKTYGVVRITKVLKAQNLNFPVGEHRVRRIMRENGIFCETVRRFRPHGKSAVDSHGKNLLCRNFSISKLNTVWVTDITYIYVPNYGFTYLTTFIDLASRKPIGWHYSKDMTTNSVLTALKAALKNTGFPKDVIIHSDRGSQFTSHEFRKFLELMKLKQSLSQKGCPYDNAVIESFHASLKKEFVYRTYFHSFKHARLGLFDYIENFYIRKRIHSAIGYITPLEMEKRLNAVYQAAA